MLDDILGIVILAVVVAAVLVLSLACFAAQAFALEVALGALAGGLILSASQHREAIEEPVKLQVAVFATFLFVLIGSGPDLSVLDPFNAANHEGLVMAAFLLVAVMVGKVAAGWSYLRREPTNRLAVGLDVMPRGVLGPSLEAALLPMVMGTTSLAPVLLRVVPADPGDAVEVVPRGGSALGVAEPALPSAAARNLAGILRCTRPP